MSEDYPYLIDLPLTLRDKLFNEIKDYFLKIHVDLTLIEKNDEILILNIEFYSYDH
jgi:hypothetical protein